ncbi:MAG: phytochelatin synthase family protein [Cyanobacteriota bacterium]
MRPLPVPPGIEVMTVSHHQSSMAWLTAGKSAAVSAAVCLLANAGWAAPLASSLAQAYGKTGTAPAAQQLIPFADPAGQDLRILASGQGDYGPLAQWFETQANLASCGVASAVMVLNSLAVEAPPVQGYGSYRFWTQAKAFSIPGSRGFVRAEVVAQEGMTLAQLQGWLAQHPQLVVERFHADRLSLAQWRALLRRSLKDPQDRLLVNYNRSAMGQAGEGHISPVAAYDPHSDRTLILDVARYRYPPVWVSADILWHAMRTTDSSSGRSRGLLLIRRR